MIDRNADYQIHGSYLGDIGDAARSNEDTTKEYSINEIPELILAGGKRKLDVINPTGSGAMSLNRKSGSTIGTNSVAVGLDTTSQGSASMAQGASSRAVGTGAHAEGSSTNANATSTHAEGEGTIADSAYQHVQGKHNKSDTSSTYADIIGNGTSGNKKNIEATTWTGDKRIKGDAYVHCGNDSSGGNVVATQADLEVAENELRTDMSEINETLTNNISLVNSTLTSSINTVNTTLTNSLNTHSQPASRITAGTFPGQIVAQDNTNYGTKQLRNIILSAADPSGGVNGDIWIKYY